MPKSVYQANFSFNPFIIINGCSMQTGVKKLVIAQSYINSYGKSFTYRSCNKVTADLPCSIFIEFCKLKFLFFLKQLLQYVMHEKFL